MDIKGVWIKRVNKKGKNDSMKHMMRVLVSQTARLSYIAPELLLLLLLRAHIDMDDFIFYFIFYLWMFTHSKRCALLVSLRSCRGLHR